MSSARMRSAVQQPRRPIILLVAGAFVGAALAAAGLTVSAHSGALPAGVVAMVNGQPIATEDYARMLQAVASDKRDPLSGADRQHVLDRIIEEELLVQRGLDLGLARQDRRVRSDLITTVIDGVVSDANEREPNDEEVAAFFSANRDFFAGPGRIRMRQVFVRLT